MSCDLFYFFFPLSAESNAFQSKLCQIKDLTKFMKEKCSLPIHQYKHNNVVHDDEYRAVHVNLVGVSPTNIINFIVGEIITLRFQLGHFLMTMERCCPCPTNVDFVATLHS